MILDHFLQVPPNRTLPCFYISGDSCTYFSFSILSDHIIKRAQDSVLELPPNCPFPNKLPTYTLSTLWRVQKGRWRWVEVWWGLGCAWTSPSSSRHPSLGCSVPPDPARRQPYSWRRGVLRSPVYWTIWGGAHGKDWFGLFWWHQAWAATSGYDGQERVLKFKRVWSLTIEGGKGSAKIKSLFKLKERF